MRGKFPGVDVSLPSASGGALAGGRGQDAEEHEIEEDWQAVDWVSFTRGEIAVDEQFGLSISYTVGTSVDTKPLGALRHVAGGGGDEGAGEGGLALMVTTSDKVQPLYRFSFQSAHDRGEFEKLAEAAKAAAEAAAERRRKRAEREASAAGQAAEASAAKLEAAVRRELLARRPGVPPPLLYRGAELFGPAPLAVEQGSEVRLGAGVVALCDPIDDGRVGTWELLFFDEDDEGGGEGAGAGAWKKEPFKKVIGPRLRYKVLAATDAGADDGDSDGSEAQPSVQLQFDSAMPRSTFSLSFDSQVQLQTFVRDLRVRQAVMQLSNKVNQGRRTAVELKGELQELKHRSVCAQFGQLLAFLLLVGLILSVLRVRQLYAEDHGARAPSAYAQQLASEAKAALRFALGAARSAGARVCQATFAADLVRAEDLNACLNGMPGYGKFGCAEVLLSDFIARDA